ncbi:MAG: L-serine ammonia-lyase, iron-sulfur-dependent, subunit beta [[Clostridium] scindens]
MYHNFSELQDYCNRSHVLLWEAVLKNEIRITHEPKELIYDRARRRLAIMESAVKKHIARPSEPDGNYIAGMSARQHDHKDNGICGAFINRVMAYALSCSEANASMGKVCAAPTAGSCGILPAVLIGMKEELSLKRKRRF